MHHVPSRKQLRSARASAFRIYGPHAPAFDGTWKLNDITEVR